MSCIEVHLERVDSSLKLERSAKSFLSLGETTSSYCSLARILSNSEALLERTKSFLSLQRQVSGIVLERVCDVFGGPYLEISPELIWVFPDLESFNDVYSNIEWNID